MRYNSPAGDRREKFLPGSLRWLEKGVVLREQHNRQAPIVRFVPYVEGDSVMLDVDLPDTSRGRDAATMVRNGTLTGLSVEFQTVRQSHRAGTREIADALLVGAGLVDDSSYPASTVQVRQSGIKRRRFWL